MRLKKGTNVEVFHSTKTLPNGSWRPAMILCGNGHSYNIQYDHLSSSPVKIPRKLIRPSPLIKENSKPINWAVGDLAEVFIHGGWTNGKLTGVAYGNEFYFVMLIDHSREISVRRDNLRLRRVWRSNKWILIKKDSERRNDIKKRKSDDIIMHEQDCESTGSCSTSGRLHNYNNYTSFPLEDDEAMSSCPSTKRTKTQHGKEMKEVESKEEIHRLELDEYIATMRELYQNGFITWEQEAMLANLRVFLNISHDEHRSVLRSLRPS
ncbi:hypothetical protein LUZ60_011975 [Juncus effusus]|nr:hypothetical protein LUZ60_011975 [Juncus effusus]